jgi:hypothetical protein
MLGRSIVLRSLPRSQGGNDLVNAHPGPELRIDWD